LPLIALLVEGVFHWGFSVRVVSESAAANPYPVPPPTTLVGALAYGYAITKGVAECFEAKGYYSTAAKIFDHVLWASFGFKKLNEQCFTPCTDMIRMFSLIYQRGERHKWKYYYEGMWFGVRGHGKVYYPNGGFMIVYLLDDGIQKLFESHNALIKAASAIPRIGSRESLVSIATVKTSSKIEKISTPFKTSFYFPTRLVKYLDEDHVISTSLPIITKEFYAIKRSPVLPGAHEDYFVPVQSRGFWSPGEVTIYELASEASGLRIIFDGESHVDLVVPTDVVNRVLR